MNPAVWQKCLKHLEAELTSQQYNTWIRPLHVIEKSNELEVIAPNRFVLDWIRDKYSARIETPVIGVVAGTTGDRCRSPLGTNAPQQADIIPPSPGGCNRGR